MDADLIASLVQKESQPSLTKAVRVIAKLCAVTLLGFALAARCTFGFACFEGPAEYVLMPSGVIVIAVTAAWVDVIQKECSCERFFPSDALNRMGSLCFRWQVGLFVAALLLVLSSAWSAVKYAILPLALMHVVRFIEPFHFRRAREDLTKAESLVQQLIGAKSKSESDAKSPKKGSATSKSATQLLDIQRIPLYKLGSVSNLLRKLAADFQESEKLSVDIFQDSDAAKSRSAISYLFSPFRCVAGEVFLWEERDIWLYVIVVTYLSLSYIGSYHIDHLWYAPFCILLPLLGPKSRAGRHLRKLQEDIRLTQGKQVEKKGGLEPKTVDAHNFDWNVPMLIYIGGTHVMALWALLVLVLMNGRDPIFGKGTQMTWETVGFAFAMYIMSGLGITAGVHRLWSHRSYKATTPLRIVLMVFNSMANQGTIIHWARDHRTHHLYSDTDADPHDANLGFWHSHVGWLITKKRKEVYAAGREVNISDLKADPVVMFQKKTDPFWNLLWCFAFPGFMSLAWGDTMWNGFLLGGVLRYTLMINATWCVNSVVHAYGSKPYNPSHRTTENGWVSFFAMGEGWHNWHHAFPWDYAASELEPHMQFNPTKVFLDACALLGLVTDRKRGNKVWGVRKRRWEEANGRKVMESLEGPILFKKRVITFGPQDYGGDATSLEEDTTFDRETANVAAGSQKDYVAEAVGSSGPPQRQKSSSSQTS